MRNRQHHDDPENRPLAIPDGVKSKRVEHWISCQALTYIEGEIL